MFSFCVFFFFFYNGDIIRKSWKEPARFINEKGEEEIHRIIISMYKMDTQEYAAFAHTKNINKDMKYGCAKCNDLTVDLMNPKRISCQYPRGFEQIMEIAGFEKTGPDDQYCKRFADWKKKGRGYVPIDFDMLPGKYEPDPSYVITTDISHAAKNLVQQLFTTLMALEKELKKRAKSLFQDMISICEYNNLNVKLTMKNWSNKTFLTDINLEIAPKALVTFNNNNNNDIF